MLRTSPKATLASAEGTPGGQASSNAIMLSHEMENVQTSEGSVLDGDSSLSVQTLYSQQKMIDIMLGQLLFEEPSTDAGSSASDGESTCSVMACGHHAEVGQNLLNDARLESQQVAVMSPAPPPDLTFGDAHVAKRQSSPPLTSHGGTPLEPIPGTPITRKDAFASAPWACDTRDPPVPSVGTAERPPAPPLPSKEWIACSSAERATPVLTPLPQAGRGRSPVRAADEGARGVEAQAQAPTNALPPTSKAVPACDSQAPPVSPKQRQRAEVLAQAKKSALPVKVRIADCVPMASLLNPSLPAKKRPPFPELTRPEVATLLVNIDPTVPVSKRVSNFLVTGPPSVVSVLGQPR